MQEFQWVLDNYEYIVAVVLAAGVAGTAIYKAPTVKDKASLIKAYIPTIKKHYPKIKSLVVQVVTWAKRKK